MNQPNNKDLPAQNFFLEFQGRHYMTITKTTPKVNDLKLFFLLNENGLA